MTLTVITYLLYLTISIGLTLLVGRTLFTNGRGFLVDIFNGDTNLADSINKLLLVGFYLVNVGYVSLTMHMGMDILSAEHMMEKLSYKIGVILLVLAGMHFMNLIVLYKMRKRNREELARRTYTPATPKGFSPMPG